MNEIIFLNQGHLIVYSKKDGIFIQSRVELTSDVCVSQDTLQNRLVFKRGYTLIIPDNLIYLISTNITNAKKHKVKDMVKYHLKYLFPEEEIQDRFGFILSSPIIGCVYNNKLETLYHENKRLFESAGIITTPSLIVVASKHGKIGDRPYLINSDIINKSDSPELNKVCPQFSHMILKHDDMFLNIVGKLTDYTFPEGMENINIETTNNDVLIESLNNIIKDKKSLAQLSLRLFLDDEKKNTFTLNKRDFTFTAIVYIILIAAMFLKTIPIDKNINNYKNALNELYKKAGIEDKVDPYGSLLFKINQIKAAESSDTNILQTLSAIGNAFNEELTVESITITPATLKMKGKINNYQALETGLIKLSKLIQMKLAIDTTDVAEDKVNFTITGMTVK
jgi:hypothetical protein